MFAWRAKDTVRGRKEGDAAEMISDDDKSGKQKNNARGGWVI
jgi:hypothetical protein